MKKYFSLFLIILFASVLGLVGCGDIYANMKISVSETDIVLYVGEDEETNSKQISVSVSGVEDENIVKTFTTHFDNTGVATSGEWTYENGKAFVTIYALKDGVTNLTIKSLDNSIRVTSEPVKVTVIQKVESLTLDSTIKASVAKGESLNLTNLGNIGFFPIETSETQVKYSFLINGRESTEANGGNLKLQEVDGDMILSATMSAAVGTYTILATSSEASTSTDVKLSKTFNVMVYDGFSSDGIIVQNVSDALLDNLSTVNLVENYVSSGAPNAKVYNSKVLTISVKDSSGNTVTQNLKYRLTEKVGTTIGVVDVPTKNGNEFFENGEFKVIALNSGSATYSVEVAVVGDDGEVYLTKSRDITFEVVKIAEKVKIETDTNSQEFVIDQNSDIISLNVFEKASYKAGINGSRVRVVVSPNDVQDSRFKIVLSSLTTIENNQEVQHTEKLGNVADVEKFVVIKDVNGNELSFGDFLTSGSDVFISFDSFKLGNARLKNFQVSFEANSENSMPSFRADLLCNISTSVEEIIAPDDHIMKVGSTQNFVFKLKEGFISLKDNFSFKLSDTSEKVCIIDVDNIQTGSTITVPITAVGTGVCTLTVEEKGTYIASRVVKITVVSTSDYVWLGCDSALKTFLDEDNPIYNDKTEESKSIYTLKEVVVNAGYGVDIKVLSSPQNATIKSIEPEEEGDGGVISSIVKTENSFNIVTKSKEGQSVCNVKIVYYQEQDGVVNEVSVTRKFTITTYLPVTSFSWDGFEKTVIDTTLYNSAGLSEQNRQKSGIGFVDLVPVVISHSEKVYTINYNFSRSISGLSLELIDENDSLKGVRVVADLAQTTVENVVLYVTLEDYIRTYDIICNISIVYPTQIDKVTLLDGSQEIYLEAEAKEDENYHSQKIETMTEPVTAFDKALSYVVFDSQNKIYAVYDVGDEVVVKYNQDVNFLNVPLRVSAKNGEVFVSVNETLSPILGLYKIRILPSSILNVGFDDERWQSKFEDISADEISVIVVNGEEANPYRISSEDDFLNIQNKGLDKHYVLANDITLTAPFVPFSGIFTGSLKSRQYNEYDTNTFTISNLYFQLSINQDNEFTKVGIFASIDNGASIENIKIVYGLSQIEISYLNSTTFSFGVLAGENRSTNIVGLQVQAKSENDIIYINDNGLSTISQDRTAIVGGIFGLNTGRVNNSSAEVYIDSNFKELVPVAGGFVGENRGGRIVGNEDSNSAVFSRLEVQSEKSSPNIAVGGLAGKNSGFVTNMDIETIINSANISKVGGIVGFNEGTLENLYVVPKIVAKDYVGGAVGITSRNSKQSNVYVEFASSLDNLTAISAEKYVGGFAGFLLGETTFSYVNSFVNLKLIGRNSALQAGTFYGDIVADTFVGGFAGQIGETGSKSRVQSCYAKVKLSVNSTDNKTNGTSGGFAGYFYSDSSDISISYAYAITDIAVDVKHQNFTQVAGFVGGINSTTGQILECYSVLGGGEGLIYSNSEEKSGNCFIGEMIGGNKSIISKCYYADNKVSQSDEINLNQDTFGVFKRTLDEMKNLDFENITHTYIDWSPDFWLDKSVTLGFNDNFPILMKNLETKAPLFSSDLTYVRLTHNPSQKLESELLPKFWSFSYKTNTSETDSFDDDLRMVVTLENLSQSQLQLTDLVTMQISEIFGGQRARLKVSSSDSSIVSVFMPTTNFNDAVLTFLRTGTVILTISSLRDVSLYTSFQICVISGFSNYSIEDANGKEIEHSDTIIVNVGKETEIYPILGSKVDYSYNYGVIYSANPLYDASDNCIIFMKDSNGQVVWVNSGENSTASLVLRANEPHIIFGNTKIDLVTLTASLFANLAFYDDDVLVSYPMIFDGTNPDLPENFQKTFSLKVLKGVTDARLDTYSAEVENAQEVPVKLVIETDTASDVISNLNTYVKLYKNGVIVDDVNDYLTLIDSGVNSVTFESVFSYDKVRLTENVEQLWTFKICDETGALSDESMWNVKKVLDFDLVWLPTQVKESDIKILHYLEKTDFDVDKGDDEASSDIGSGRVGVLKIEISPDFADYDYITISSSTSENDKVSLEHLYKRGRFLISTQEYSSYLDDGSLKITKENSDNSVYYMTTFISAGLPVGTAFTLTINVYKNGEKEPVTTKTKVLTSSFAPYVTMTTTSAGNMIARGSDLNVKLQGVTSNSTITFEISGVERASAINSELQTVVVKDAETKSFPRYENISGTISLNLSVYAGILSNAKDGMFTIRATVESYDGSSKIITYSEITLYLVDYMITEISAKDSTDGVLESVIQYGYTPLQLNFVASVGTAEEAEQRFKEYTGNTFIDSFQTAYVALAQKIQDDISEIEMFGISGKPDRSAWLFEGTHISADFTYNYFFVGRLENYLGIKGKREAEVQFKIEFARAYIQAETMLECKLDPILDEIEDYVLGTQDVYQTEFTIKFVNGSTADEPEQITTVQELINMAPNGHYILMNDLTLTKWVPLTTKIGSLDGNGHVLYIESFAPKTKNSDGGMVSAVNVGLFESISTYTESKTNKTEQTRLINIVLDISRTTWTNLTKIQTVNFGFLVGVNDGGIIYNCEVINTVTNQGLDSSDANFKDSWYNYYLTDVNQQKTEEDSISLDNYVYARNIFEKLYFQAKENYNSTFVSTFIFVSPEVKGEIVDANIGGLVGLNNGFITHCRVGRVSDEIGVNTSTKYGFNLFGGGSLGGLVGKSTGTISSSYFANGSIVNMSTIINKNVISAGLVAYNSGKITTSYVEGVKYEPIALVNENGYYRANINGKNYTIILNDLATNRGVLYLNSVEKARIVDGKFTLDGLVYKLDTSSSILEYELKSTRTTGASIYFNGSVGGFVHSNYGEIENCYSNITISSSLGVGGFVYENASENSSIMYSYTASRIISPSNITGAFTGVDKKLNILNSGLIENCYYLEDYEIVRNDKEPANAISQEDLSSETGESLSGFVFGKNGVWTLNTSFNSVPHLYEADNISFSNRIVTKDGAETEGILTYNSDLPGASTNPRLVYNVETFNLVFNNLAESSEKYVRFIADVNFVDTSPLYSSGLVFKGNLQGNGMNINNLTVLSDQSVDIGLFKKLDNATVSNLLITVNTISGTSSNSVGGLAGKINKSTVNNIKILPYNQESSISGYNITGGLAGTSTGESKIANIISKVSIYSTFDIVKGQVECYYNFNDMNQNVSYAGGVIGVLTQESGFKTNKNNPSIVNCVTSGDVTIKAFVVGGVFGLVDTNIVVSSAKFVLNDEQNSQQKLEADNIAGGVVGENRGAVIYSYIAMSDSNQRQSDQEYNLTGNSESQTGLKTLFADSPAGSPKVIGGLVGLNVGTGGEDVSDQTGGIEYSYSRVDVVNENAFVAGGLVGLAITKTSELSAGIENFLNNQSISVYGTETNSAFKTSFGNISIYAQSLYNTGKVKAKNTAGGFVGITTAPVNTIQANAELAIIPSTVESENFKGSIFGKSLYKTQLAGTDVDTILFVDSSNMAISDSVVVTKTCDNLVGNQTNVYEPRVLDTDVREYILDQVVTSGVKMSAVFKKFSTSKWSFDETLENNIFPRLSLGKSVSVQEISNIDEFFAYIQGGKGGNYRIINDLTFDFSGTDSQGVSIEQKFRDISSESSPVSGSLQGYGTGGEPITIKVVYNDNALPVFGYLSMFELSNINFEFENASSINNIENFGLLCYTASNCGFSKVKIVMANSLNFNNIQNLGGIVGKSSSCTFRNVLTSVKFANEEFTSNYSVLAIGGISGSIETRSTFESVTTSLDVNVKSTVIGISEINIGGIVGLVKGNITVDAYGNSKNTTSGNINADSNSVLYVGGVFAQHKVVAETQDVKKVDAKLNLVANSAQNIYAGGIIGLGTYTNLQNLYSKTQMDITGSSDIYAGGIGGEYQNSLRLEKSISYVGTFENCSANNDIVVTNKSNTAKKNFVGGLFGLVYNNVNVVKTSQIETIIYQDSFASGKIKIIGDGSDAVQRVAYLGGLIGQVYSKNTTYDSEYQTHLKLSKSASETSIVAQNIAIVYMGGIAGYSSMIIDTCINYGMLSTIMSNTNYTASNSILYQGGIVGYATSYVTNSISLGAVMDTGIARTVYVGGVYQTMRYVQAVVGFSNSKTPSSMIVNCYYNSDLTGTLQTDYLTSTNIKHMLLADILKANVFDDKGALSGVITSGHKLDDFSKVIYLPYIEEIASIMNLETYYPETGKTLPNYASLVILIAVMDFNDLDQSLKDASYPSKTVYLVNNMVLDNISLTNVSRVIGGGQIVTTSSFVFGEIPNNCLVSGIYVKGSNDNNIDVTSSSHLIFGTLTPTNNGAISNCVLGGLPDYKNNNTTLADRSLNLDSRSLGENDEVLQINVDLQTNSATKAFVGGLVGQNNGLITNSWSYFDLNIDITGESINSAYIGGLVGYNCGELSYSYSMGKQNITNLVEQNSSGARTTYVGGVVGYSSSVLHGLIGMIDFDVNISTTYLVGGVVGYGDTASDVVYVEDMSRSLNKVTTNVSQSTTKSKKVTTNDLLSQSLKTLGLNSFVYTRDSETNTNAIHNYGLPFLITNNITNYKNGIRQNIIFTGNGVDRNYPYEISNYVLLSKFVSDKDKSIFALTRDLVATKTIGNGQTVISRLYGNGFVIFADDINVLGNGGNYSVFNISLSGDEGAGKIDGVMLKVGGAIKSSSTNLSIAPLLIKNNGADVTNCAVFGEISVTNGAGRIGGLVAEHLSGKVSNCWTDVKITVTNGRFNIGGIIGNMGSTKEAYLTTSFASGNIKVVGGKNSLIGGLVGKVTGVTSGTSSAKIDSCYFSGLTKHSSKNTIFEIANENYYGAFVGSVGDASDKELTIDKFGITNSYFAGKLGNSDNYYNNAYTKVMVGYYSGSVQTSKLNPYFNTVYISSLQTVAWSDYLAHSVTAGYLKDLTSANIGYNYNFISGYRPTLAEVTPADRMDNYS